MLDPNTASWTRPIPASTSMHSIVAKGVNRMRGPDRGMLVITHYQRLLDYIVPDARPRHVRRPDRQISGDAELAHELEDKGYDWVLEEFVGAPA